MNFFDLGNGRPNYEEKKDIIDYLTKKYNETLKPEDDIEFIFLARKKTQWGFSPCDELQKYNKNNY